MKIVENVARQAVALVDELQKTGGRESAKNMRDALLQEVRRSENTQVDGVKYIVELAHVVGECFCIEVSSFHESFLRNELVCQNLKMNIFFFKVYAFSIPPPKPIFSFFFKIRFLFSSI